jgi:hypothetical protein
MRVTTTAFRSVGLFSFILALLVAAWAKDFWEAKPFTQWDEKEAVALLTASPWARSMTVLGSTLKSAPRESDRASQLPRPVGPGMTSGSGLPQAGVNFSDGDPVPVYVRWLSSRKVREALGRLAQLQSKVPEAEVHRAVNQPTADYMISIVAPVMTPFNEVSFDDLKEQTFLISKKDKNKKLQLKAYTPPKDRGDGVAVFTFARTPALELADDEVQFVTRVKKIEIKAPFKLARMIAGGSLDL